MRIYELDLADNLGPMYFEVNPRIVQGNEKSRIKLSAKAFLKTEKGIKFIEKYGTFTWADIFEIPNDIYQKFGLTFLPQPLQVVSETVEKSDTVLDPNDIFDTI